MSIESDWKKSRKIDAEKLIKNIVKEDKRWNLGLDHNGLNIITKDSEVVYRIVPSDITHTFAKQILDDAKFSDFNLIIFRTSNISNRSIIPLKSKEIRIPRLDRHFNYPDMIKLPFEALKDICNKRYDSFINELFRQITHNSQIENDFRYRRTIQELVDKDCMSINKYLEITDELSGHHNEFRHQCENYRLKEYLSSEDKQLNTLLKEKVLICEIDSVNFYDDNRIYPSILCAYLYYMAQYNRMNNQKVFFLIDCPFPFIDNHYVKKRSSFEESLADKAFKSIHNKKNTELTQHKAIMLFQTSFLETYEVKDKIKAQITKSILKNRKNAVIDVSGTFIQIAQKYLDFGALQTHQLSELGRKIEEYWDEKEKDETANIPFRMGFLDHLFGILEIDFTRIPLKIPEVISERALFQLASISENDHIELKFQYKGCEDRTIKQIGDLLNNKGGTILIGIQEGGSYQGVKYDKEEKNFEELRDAIYQKIRDDITPTPFKLIDIKRFRCGIREYLYIAINLPQNKEKFKVKGNTRRRFGPIGVNEKV